MSDHDDELGAFLRSEVPEPSAGYWDGIDAMLHRVEGEGEGAGAPAADQTGVGEAPIDQRRTDQTDQTQTDDDVIRLTDMTHISSPSLASPERRYIPMLVAAALIAVVGVGTVFALTRDRSTTSVDAADDGSPATDAPAAVDDDGDTDGVDETDDAVAPPSDVDPVDELAGRLCYSDGTVTLTLDFIDNGTFSGWQVPVGLADDGAGLPPSDLHLTPNGSLLQTIGGVVTDEATGAHRVSESSIAAIQNGFSSISTSDWTITSTLVTQPGHVEEAKFPAVDCADAARDLEPVESTPAFFPPDAPVDPVTITETVTTPGQNRVCYSQGPGEGVLIFDFTDDGASANGLKSNAVETISATRTFDGDTTYNVATLILGDQENGRDTVTTFLWEITPERINLPFDGEEIPAADCADFADEVAQAENLLGAVPYPAYPLGS